jgi:LPXTG-motif cell wall-anchored protein
VVGDQIPSLEDKVKEDKQENHENKTVHDRFEKEHQKHKKDIEESLPQLPESPVSELPEPSSQVVDTNKEKTETKDKESSFMKGANPTTIQPKEAQQSLLNQKQTAQIEKNTNTDSTSEGEAPVVRTRSGTLPKTATNAPNGVVAGGFILLGGALIHRYYRVKNDA